MSLSAFQSNAFQSNAFQIGRVRQTATQNSGGYFHDNFPVRRRTDEQLRAERIKLGIIPSPVEKAVAKVAERIVNKAEPGVDPLALLAEESARYEAQMQKQFQRQQLEYQQRYMQLLALQIAVMVQDQEDEQIVHLLMEM